MILFNLFRVGLSSKHNFKCAGHVAEGGALDQTENDRSAWIVWTRGPPDLIKRTCFKEGVITAQINARGEHPDRRIAIKRRQSNALYNAYQRGLNPSPPSRSDGHDLREMVHGEPFHLNSRLKSIGRLRPKSV